MFLGFHPCEKCGSSDAKAEYPTAYHCFSCGSHTKKGGLSLFKPQTIVNVCKGITLQKELSTEARKWLLGYGLTLEEMQQFTYARERVGKYGLMPCNLLILYADKDYWCARNFGMGAKYITSGSKPILKYGNNSDTVILVEDIISAIKVGRQFTAIPMLGSMPLESILSHLKGFKNVMVWNDRDLAVKSVKTARNLSERLGLRVKVVISPNDPKEYSDLDIKNYIYNILINI